MKYFIIIIIIIFSSLQALISTVTFRRDVIPSTTSLRNQSGEPHDKGDGVCVSCRCSIVYLLPSYNTVLLAPAGVWGGIAVWTYTCSNYPTSCYATSYSIYLNDCRKCVLTLFSSLLPYAFT